MNDLGLVFIEDQTPGCQPLGELGFGLFGLLRCVSADHQVVGVPDQDRAARHRVTGMTAGCLVPDPCGPFQPMERHIHH
ncbi:MAG: hypothetical protein WA970_23260, partial [Gammaproteobacteria bacterium]